MTLHQVQPGDTLEGVARKLYGDNWRAGMAQMMSDNGIRLNKYGSPLIQPGQDLKAWDLSVYSDKALTKMGSYTDAVMANNDKGLAYKAELETQRAQQQAAIAEQQRYGAQLADIRDESYRMAAHAVVQSELARRPAASDYATFAGGTIRNLFVSTVAGIDSLGTFLLTGGNVDAAAAVNTSIQEKYGWKPTSPREQSIAYSLATSAPVQFLNNLKQSTGEYYYSRYGALAGAAGYTAPDALLTLAAPYAGKVAGVVAGGAVDVAVTGGRAIAEALAPQSGRMLEQFAYKMGATSYAVPPEFGGIGGAPESVAFDATKVTVKDIPTFKSGQFNEWFDSRTSDEIAALYEQPSLRAKIESGLRGAGGNHEMLMVAEAPKWSQWGATAKMVQEDFAIPISDLNEGGLANGWTHATGLEGSTATGSKTVHNQLQKIIQNSDSLSDFKVNIRPWAEKWINGGYEALPPGFHN
jgi:hypothetical protein